jgi:hypothetical protein
VFKGLIGPSEIEPVDESMHFGETLPIEIDFCALVGSCGNEARKSDSTVFWFLLETKP